MNINKCWIVTEGMAGTENQCIAVAESLGVNFEIKQVSLLTPFDILCPHIIKTAPRFAVQGINWDTSPPDLIIASGRKAIPVALKFKKAIKVFIQDPKINPKYFDLVAAPAHDVLSGDNVITTIAAPNRITENLLNKAANQFDYKLISGKKIAVLIGGNSKAHAMRDDFAYSLFEMLMPYIRSGQYTLLITASRRTPPDIMDDLHHLFDYPNCTIWDGNGENPYHAYLAAADYILVTEDSTSMLSDACTTGKPVYRLRLEGGSDKFNRLYTSLKTYCDVDVFDGELVEKSYQPLNDAKMIADEIKKRFDNR